MEVNRKHIWMWLKNIFPYTDAEVYKLLEIFGDIEEIYYADVFDKFNFKANIKRKLSDKGLLKVYQTLNWCSALNVNIISIEDDEYPEPLRHIFEPPPLLYVRGDVSCLKHEVIISGVGTRSCNEYGESAAYNIAKELAESGVLLCSGMARGIDTAVNTGALDGGGKTIAVLGTSIDKIYPPENASLYRGIIEKGAVVSEHPPGYRGCRIDFPRRNRIIAGLARGVFVCQAPARSGSLITARMALDMGRDLFCVAGNIEPINEGGNALLSEGAAKVVITSDDILCEYFSYERKPSPEENRQEKSKNISSLQQRILSELGYNKLSEDELCERLDINYAELARELTSLEISDIIAIENGSVFLK